MNAKFFLDTNILVYSFDPTQKDKRDKSRELIESGLETGLGCISFQVIQEFLSLTTRKFPSPMNPDEALKYLRGVLIPLCDIYASAELYAEALEIFQRWRFSFYDSLIVTAALRSNCKILYSEDLQHDQKIQDLKILNPYQGESF